MLQHTSTYQEHHSSYLKKIWQRARNVVQVFFAKDFTTYQERVASHLKKMLQRIRNICQVSWKNTTYKERFASYLQVGRCCKYQERFACYLTKTLQHIRNIIQVTWRRCDNVSGTSLNPPHVPAPCPQVSPKPTPSVPKCPQVSLNAPQVSPSVP